MYYSKENVHMFDVTAVFIVYLVYIIVTEQRRWKSDFKLEIIVSPK